MNTKESLLLVGRYTKLQLVRCIMGKIKAKMSTLLVLLEYCQAGFLFVGRLEIQKLNWNLEAVIKMLSKLSPTSHSSKFQKTMILLCWGATAYLTSLMMKKQASASGCHATQQRNSSTKAKKL